MQVFERSLTPDGIRPGQHLAVPVQLAPGEIRSWRLPVSSRNYSVQMLPGRDTLRVPRLAAVGAICDHNPAGPGYEYLGGRGASVIAYHPRQTDPGREWSGMVAVVSQYRP